MRTRGLWVLGLLAIFSGMMVSAAQASVTLADLLGGATIEFGDKKFYDFENATTSGTLEVDYEDIEVFVIVGGFTGNEIGLRFQSAQWVLDGVDQSYDLGFDFKVMTKSGAELITDNTLEITGGVIGDGRASVAENVRDEDGNDLAEPPKFVYITADDSKTQDYRVFPYPVSIAQISKDFGMITGADGGIVFVSHFDQTFSQIPEPSTVVLMGLGLAGLGVMKLRRGRKSS